VIYVVNAVITAKGECEMITSTTEETGTGPATTAGETPKPNKKARVAPSPAPVAPAKAKSGKKASPNKKAPKSRTRAKVAKPEARGGSKGAKILDLLKRPGGATSKELEKATGWQAHSIRGFLSGVVGRKMGLPVTSAKGEDGKRNYSVKG
jgi:hypothetical protein